MSVFTKDESFISFFKNTDTIQTLLNNIQNPIFTQQAKAMFILQLAREIRHNKKALKFVVEKLDLKSEKSEKSDEEIMKEAEKLGLKSKKEYEDLMKKAEKFDLKTKKIFEELMEEIENYLSEDVVNAENPQSLFN